jgi:cytidylate kinase
MLLLRDKIDSGRTTAPLTRADDAVHIDTTGYTLEEVIDQVIALVDKAGV